jgi:RNase P subunit RPR2
MVNAKLHIICGNCGCNHMFEYAVRLCIDDSVEPEQKYQDVTITCDNCSTIHWLRDNAEQKN